MKGISLARLKPHWKKFAAVAAGIAIAAAGVTAGDRYAAHGKAGCGPSGSGSLASSSLRNGCPTPTFTTTTTTTGGGGGAVANLWVHLTAGTCTRSATLIAWNDATDCGSMQAAQTVAQPGDTIIVKCGAYPSQTLSTGAKSSAVTYLAESYDAVTTAEQAYTATTCATVANLTINIDHVHVYGIQATQQPVVVFAGRTDADLRYQGGGVLNFLPTTPTGCCTDIYIDGWHGRQSQTNASGVTINHSVFGFWDGCYDTTGTLLPPNYSGNQDGYRFWTGGPGTGTVPTNETFENSVVGNIIMGVNDTLLATVCGYGSGTGPHVDCMQFGTGYSNIQLLSSYWFNCPSQDLEGSPSITPAFSGAFLAENDYFGPANVTIGSRSTGSGNCASTVFRNITFNGALNPGCASAGGGTIQIYGSYQGKGCYNGGNPAYVNYHDDAAPPGLTAPNTCPGAHICTPLFVTPLPGNNYGINPALPNVRLQLADTCLNGTDTAGVVAATDIFGSSRPGTDSLPSVGAHEPG